MPHSSDQHADEKSLPRLLLDLLWQIAVLLIPIFLVTVIPLLWALGVVLACAALMWLTARLGWQRTGRGAARLMTSAAIGLGFNLGRALPAYWDIAGAAVVMFCGLACVSHLEKRFGLADKTPAKSSPLTGGQSSGGASAWGGDEPRQTPEGEPIRVFNYSEIAMGGPVLCDYLFPDGVLLQGLGSSARFSNDGRYFAAPLPSRQAWGLVILDRQLRQLYQCSFDEFWELDAFNDGTLSGRYSPLVDNGARQISLEQLLATAERIDLVPVADLWLEPGDWQTNLAHETLRHTSPDAQQRLDAHPALPASLRELPQPCDPLRYPEYRVDINGEPTSLLIRADTAIIWNPDSRSFGCRARMGEDQALDYWLWHADRGWQTLPCPWIAADSEPSMGWSEPLALDDHYLRLSSYFDYPQPDHGLYGYGLHSIHSDCDSQVGHAPNGRIQVAERLLTQVQLAVPLAGDGQRGATMVESAAVTGKTRAQFRWQQDNSLGLGGYTCTIGDWALPGVWLLDHRVSDAGRYIALIPFTLPPASAGYVLVADAQERQLLNSPPLLAARLLDFRGPRLSVAVIRGRLDQDRPGSPLQRFDQSPPEAGDAAEFSQYRPDSRLYYEWCELEVSPEGLSLLPDWRLVKQPQSSVADGNFVQPAPTNNDAAWLFGCETEYADSWLRVQSPRLGGHLLTASGCAISDLAPSMIWSEDARYLALTRLHTDVEDEHGGRLAWRVLLLDVRERTLRQSPQQLRNRPQFESFKAEVLKVRLFLRDWEAEDETDRGSITALKLSELLALPAEALSPSAELWLTKDQLSDTDAWRALDTSPLSHWR
ncbi:hypothetical protein [Pseudomonas nunensis]|uniref:Uncharacterized protein n=1 Tax=Pseudomonas nunensis TaxID=2961896 RepID=A0ABY5EP43_9PSED|nr:hypothetical protein [Pseudomonas nunensis]KPN90911.1 hypothetical protein AL066_11425 [Pseudomonas nunensis]MCL5228268.1 hypothetical protein [Pseudomonas nunensis]UTO17177.1 hypothetical protein NK667_12755 [Pseudomonas nunensis]